MNVRKMFKAGRRIQGAEDDAVGSFCGEVGVRSEFVLTCTTIIPLFEGLYVKIYQFKDDNANVVINFASKDGSWSVGEKYRIRARVKRHSVYGGVKQTQITYLKTVELFYERDESDKITADESWNAI